MEDVAGSKIFNIIVFIVTWLYALANLVLFLWAAWKCHADAIWETGIALSIVSIAFILASVVCLKQIYFWALVPRTKSNATVTTGSNATDQASCEKD